MDSYVMQRRPLFGVVSMGMILLVTVVYVVIAESARFDLLAVKQAGQHWVAHRSWEVMFVWSIACLAYGWVVVALKRMRFRTPNALPVALVPIVIGVLLGGYKLYAYNRWPFGKYVGPPGGQLQWILLGLALAIFPAGLGGLLGYTLIFHAKIWRRFGSDRVDL